MKKNYYIYKKIKVMTNMNLLKKFNDKWGSLAKFIPDYEERYSSLTNRERDYFDLMLPQSGVLYLKSHPGLGKSATVKSIADKMGMNFFDIRLTLVDETDVGLYPDVQKVKNSEGEDLNVLVHITPMWSHRSNEAPSIILFDELNRSRLEVRNASLQLLLERAIGTEFKFNNMVFMCACGNLGDEDGTDVDELDAALNNRLIHRIHENPFDEWYEAFAKDNVVPEVNKYLTKNKHKLFVPPNFEDGSNEDAYPTNRSWTFLSDQILYNGYDSVGGELVPNKDKILKIVSDKGSSFIGSEFINFLSYLKDMYAVSLEDILDRFEEVEDKLDNWVKGGGVDSFNRIIHELQRFNYGEVDEKRSHNIIKFMDKCNDELIVTYIDFLMGAEGIETDPDNGAHPLAGLIFKNYREVINKVIDSLGGSDEEGGKTEVTLSK